MPGVGPPPPPPPPLLLSRAFLRTGLVWLAARLLDVTMLKALRRVVGCGEAKFLVVVAFSWLDLQIYKIRLY